MTKQKILEVVDKYEKLLNMFRLSPLFTKELEHVLEMIPKVRSFVAEDRLEKCFRWLGFIQGILWSHQIYSIQQLKEHNMSKQ